eukprot:COSAG01_NODE_39185_length_479_cov_11.110526_1_plen_44_part_00
MAHDSIDDSKYYKKEKTYDTEGGHRSATAGVENLSRQHCERHL